MTRSRTSNLLIKLIVLFNTISFINSECFTWDFNKDGWSPIGPYNWKFSQIDGPADDSAIPTFSYTTGYMYFQNQNSPTSSYGTVVSPSVVLYSGTQVFMAAFRHLIVPTGELTSRPLLRFGQTESTAVDIAHMSTFNSWETIYKTCVSFPIYPEDVVCCATYPCSGYFFLDGLVYVPNELLAIDMVGTQGACGQPTYPPPPPTNPPPPPPPTTAESTTTGPTTTPGSTTTPGPTTPPPPVEFCCNFDDGDLCGWSPAAVSIGWTWSSFDYPERTPTPGSPFIYAEDQGAIATSPTIHNVTADTTFNVEFYFYSDELNSNITLEFGFRDNAAADRGTVLFSTISPTSEWITASFKCNDKCCVTEGDPTCDGKFFLATTGLPEHHYVGAINTFSVDDYTC